MREPAPFAVTRDGSLLVAGDGPELLVHEGRDGSPRWKLFCEGVLVSVGSGGDQLVAADGDGRLMRFRAMDGRLEHTSELEGQPVDLSVAADGTAVVAVDSGVYVVHRNGHVVHLPVAGACAVALGPDSNAIGVGTKTGVFHAIDASTGAAWGRVELGGRVGGVAWSARGHWVVTSGSEWVCVSGDGTTITATLSSLGAAGGPVSVSADGLIVAAVAGHNVVRVAELHTQQVAGTLTFRRTVGALSFGPGFMLAIGLDEGDGMHIDVFSQKSVRTEPHAGRGRNAWNVDVVLDGAILRGALAASQAGGALLAEYTGPKPEAPTPWWQWLFGMGCGCVVLFIGTGLLMTLMSWVLVTKNLG